ncbi:MAG: alpha-glucan family phosphorylase [Steroidobacteraceae bacterium]
MSATSVPPTIDPEFAPLHRLALDLRWSWNHATDELWRQIDPDLWTRTHNPWVVLRTASHRRIAQVLANPAFQESLRRLTEEADEAAQASTWFQQAHAGSDLNLVAYFSMEYMLSEALPIYAGGLGNVAGDQLKAASDLGVPVVGVGLLYQQGYFRQVIDQDGAQRALYPYNDPGQIPVTPLRKPDGEWLRLRIAMPGHSVWLRAWQVKVGRLRLLLLDSNDIANHPTRRGITSELYGGGPELRLEQEIVLGIGGWRLLDALGLQPDVCHLNEGHAALAVLDRARTLMESTGLSFDAALTATRAGNVFTTHTAVPAGFDRFEPHLLEQYLGSYAAESLHIATRDLLALGRENPHDDAEPFNMAYLAVRGCGAINGVSRLHGEVSRRIFLPLFPRWTTAEVPIGHVTNGVHMPSWDSAESDELWTSCCGKGRWLGSLESNTERIRGVADSAIWSCRTVARASLVAYARERLSEQLAASGAASPEIEVAAHLFNPDVLTLGFARRFATYKRPNLLLHDPQRLIRLLTHAERPVQLILAGKAHPADLPAQALIQEWVRFVRRDEVRPHAVFLSDYDMFMTERLVEGVDVWINTPQRPWEACGTSGMKVLVNGGLNLSELDGWWAEAYSPKVGWALGDGQEHGDDPARNAVAAARLYDLLETQVIPEFYSRDEHNIPRAWVARVRESMASLTPNYSANRSVREYVEHAYLPAAAAYHRRARNGGALGIEISEWRRALERGWTGLRFGDVKIDTRGERHHFTVEVALGALDPRAVRVEICADGQGDRPEHCQEMTRVEGPPGGSGMNLYAADVPANRAAADYTARIVPGHPAVGVPLEAPYILWQR